jgi:AcrR family transcriptional regulator
MKLNIRERAEKVFQTASDLRRHSIRAIAKATGFSKSAVHRHHQARASRNQYPESELWESLAGGDWLRRLVVASIFIFCFQHGVGSESLSQFFRLLRLDRHIGVSPSSLRKIRDRMETEIETYQQAQLSALANTGQPIEVCGGIDETFFDQVVLVMLDLPSGFILVEEITADCCFETWQQPVAEICRQLGLLLRYCVSDRASALIKLATEEFCCPSIPDLFHVMQDLSLGLGRDLSKQLLALNKRLRNLEDLQAEATLQQPVKNLQQVIQDAQHQYRNCLHQITTCLHPFAIGTGLIQTSLQVQDHLMQQLQLLKTLQQSHQLQDTTDGLRKFEKQIPELIRSVDLWWDWAKQALSRQTDDPMTRDWVCTALLPALYWQQQAQRTKNSDLKQAYQQAADLAQFTLSATPYHQNLSPQQLSQWLSWGHWMVTKFQRTSSAVEGRNGYLTQMHHNCRGLSPRRLKVQTTIHNFYLKRADGSTAAERLFGKSSPDLFESLLKQMPILPQARRRKAMSKTKILPPSTVPA